jgi:regulator of cell morphogenesis and NO signaling
MTASTDAGTTLAQLVLERPARAAVLDRLGLDYCCHGQRSLADACAEAGRDVAEVAAELDAPDAGDAGTAPVTDWTRLGLAHLAAHIVATHHVYLWGELPALEELSAKVRTVHGERHPELAEVDDLVRALRADLEPHLAKEEQVLFPAISRVEYGDRSFPFGHVGNPIRTMMAEHDQAGELLVRLREITSDYAVPDDACGSYRALYERLSRVEADTHVHIHKENNVLFPDAIARFDEIG